VFNEAFDESLVKYGGQYENALHFSPHFREYAEKLAEELVASYSVRGKRVVELGCGDGSFLSALCRLGDNRGFGFDPAFDPARAGEIDARVSIVQKYYGPETAGEPADFVCCRHVLEHIPKPYSFIRHVRDTVGNRPGTFVFFEVPDVSWTLEQMGIWDIIYEHCNYFSRVAIRRLFAAGGFEPIATSSVYGGQFLTIRARPGPVAPTFPRIPDSEDAHFRALIDRFGDRQKTKVAEWRTRLVDLARQGKRAVLWGAGSKGVTFLNTLGMDSGSGLTHIVDVNPRKQGCFVAGSGQQIISPQTLRSLKPDVVVIMNLVYSDEIKLALRDLGVDAAVLEA
jgi:SAM-dependent methyltransferase